MHASKKHHGNAAKSDTAIASGAEQSSLDDGFKMKRPRKEAAQETMVRCIQELSKSVGKMIEFSSAPSQVESAQEAYWKLMTKKVELEIEIMTQQRPHNIS